MIKAVESVMPPYRVYRDFLDAHTRADLLTWTIENEVKFEPTRVTSGRTDRQKSLRVLDFEPIETVIRQRVLDLAPTLIRDLRMSQLELAGITTELVAHNDGAFFKRHIDRFYNVEEAAPDRIVTAVYYFHAEPKAFSGGATLLLPVRNGGWRDHLYRRLARAEHASRLPLIGSARSNAGQMPVEAICRFTLRREFLG